MSGKKVPKVPEERIYKNIREYSVSKYWEDSQKDRKEIEELLKEAKPLLKKMGHYVTVKGFINILVSVGVMHYNICLSMLIESKRLFK
jgi:hypothetical protein